MDTQMNFRAQQLSAIDRALAAAKSRRAQKEGTAVVDDTTAADQSDDANSDGAPKVKAVEKTVLTAEQREEKKLQREAEKHVKMVALEAQCVARKADKAEKRASKKKTSGSASGPVHMKKIATAAAKLPQLNSDAQLAFNDLTTNFSGAQLTTLALHLAHHNRTVSTQRASTVQLKVGQSVCIAGGDHRFIGKVGVISKVQRIRCYVNIPGMEKPHYCFTSDVTRVVEAEPTEAAVG
jgi:hypothetical protein